MVSLLAAEGEVAGMPLTEEDCRILAGYERMSNELSAKAHFLVGRILDKRTAGDLDPLSFDNAMTALDPEWPNIAEITAEVATARNPQRRLHGWPLIKDVAQLVGCGIVIVLLMFAVVIVVGSVFHWN